MSNVRVQPAQVIKYRAAAEKRDVVKLYTMRAPRLPIIARATLSFDLIRYAATLGRTIRVPFNFFCIKDARPSAMSDLRDEELAEKLLEKLPRR